MKLKATVGAAFALAAFPALTMAQGSGLTISGMLDGGVSFVSNQGGAHNTTAGSGIGVPNLIFFKGHEDLGGGTSAIFELVNQINLSDGTTIPTASGVWSRQSLVGLSNKSFGTFTVGNQYEFMHDSLLFGGFDAALTYGGFYMFRQGPFGALAIPNNPTGASDFDRLAGSSRVQSSVKYLSPSMSGVSFGAMYGFGNVAGDFSAGRTMSFGVNYSSGAFGVGAAYTDARYAQMNSGHDGIRNWGLGARYQWGSYNFNLLYTNTKNTQTGGMVDAVQGGVNWTISTPWNLGVAYEYMTGNAQLTHNRAHQGTVVLQYWLSKTTNIYAQGVYQYATGDGASTQAWINGLYGANAASSGSTQSIARLGLTTRF